MAGLGGEKFRNLRSVLFQYEQTYILLLSDRIILCEDDSAANLENLIAIRKCIPQNKIVHTKMDCSEAVRTSFVGECFFSGAQEIFTPDLVMRQAQNILAKKMHELYLNGAGTTTPRWEDLSDFTKASNYAVADHLFTKIPMLLPDEEFSEITPELCSKAYDVYLKTRDEQADFRRRIEHERFMRFIGSTTVHTGRRETMKPAFTIYSVLSTIFPTKSRLRTTMHGISSAKSETNCVGIIVKKRNKKGKEYGKEGLRQCQNTSTMPLSPIAICHWIWQ